MPSKARTPMPREAIIYFRNRTMEPSVAPLETERPLWLIELEAMAPEPSMSNQPVIYYRRDGKPRRRPSVRAKRSV